MRQSFLKQFKEVKHALSAYPDFVYSKGDNAELDGLPVFLYHTIDPEVFEGHLIYLMENNYRTLSVHEFYEILTTKKKQESNRQVLLTIDDARSSVWRYAFPLLKKYKMNITVFIIPGVTEENAVVRKNLEDYWNENATIEEIKQLDPNDDTLCNWTEIKEMYNSGFVDIESHTLFHREVFSGPKISDFITPNTKFLPYNFIGSPYLSPKDASRKISKKEFIGLPIFESSPLMLARLQMIVSEDFKLKCRDIYQNSASENSTTNWKKEITKIVSDEAEMKKYFAFEDSLQDVKKDLMIAREIIQSKLDQNAGNHLCLPWTIGNETTISICKEIRVKSCFWGVLDTKKINRAGDDPFFICRLKNDFIFRLPGKGRKSLNSIYLYKIKRRLSGEKVF